MATEPTNVVRMADHPRWISRGSPEWCREIEQAINELIDRVLYLENASGLRYDRMTGAYTAALGDIDGH